MEDIAVSTMLCNVPSYIFQKHPNSEAVIILVQKQNNIDDIQELIADKSMNLIAIMNKLAKFGDVAFLLGCGRVASNP